MPRLKGTMPVLTAPISAVKSPVDCPGSTPRMADSCVRPMNAAMAAAATSQAMPSHRLRFSSAMATTTPVGTRPSTSGVHRPITAIAPSGTTNQPSTAADRRLRAPT